MAKLAALASVPSQVPGANSMERVTAYADRKNRSVNPMDPNNNRIEVILLR